jgi:hypothetical protein
VKEKAAKAAKLARQKEERDSAKAIQLSQKGKRKALIAILASNKRQKRAGSALGSGQVQDAAPLAPPRITSRGRNVNVPKKFR